MSSAITNPPGPIEEFVQRCQQLRREYAGRDPDYQAIHENINRAAQSLPAHVHPMITKICNLAEDLFYFGPDYATGPSPQEIWSGICATVAAYADNRWEPTARMLMGTYAHSDNKKHVVASFNIKIIRCQGKVSVAIPNQDLHSQVEALLKQLDSRQIDEWFLSNLARTLPRQTGKYTLWDATISEHLVSDIPDAP